MFINKKRNEMIIFVTFYGTLNLPTYTERTIYTYLITYSLILLQYFSYHACHYYGTIL